MLTDNSLRATPIDNREQIERIKKNLSVLRNQIDVYNRCLNLLEQGKNHIFDAINSTDPIDKKASIFVVVSFVELKGAEESTQVTRFARILLKILTCNDESVMRLASRAIVYLIQTSKTYAIELMEISLNQCCEWLEETQRHEERLLAAVILARDLALFTSSHFFQRAAHFFNNIFKVIRDPKLNLRMAGIQALQVALAITSQRESKQKNEWYRRCFEEACVQSSRDDLNHASLLIFNELLRIANAEAEINRLKILNVFVNSYARTVIGSNPIEWLIEQTYPSPVESRTARTLVTEHYFLKIINRCMLMLNSKSQHCQIVILEIFLRLCNFKVLNKKLSFDDMLDHAINLTTKYSQALITVGLLALNRPEDIQPKVPNIIKIIVQILQQSLSKKKPIDVAVFKCLTLLVQSQKIHLSDKIREILPILFSTGLSKGLTEVLKNVVQSIPELKTDILDGLMEQLYLLLMNRPRPSKLAPPTSPPVPNKPIQPKNIELTKLALITLGEFDFQRHTLQMFMRYIARGYLVCESTEIRLASVYCCAEIVKPFVKVHELAENEQKLEVHSLIKNVLECLVKTAVVDPEVEVRLSVLKCFCAMERDFLYHLAQREMLENLFKTLYDENFQMQEQAIVLLGQLSNLNPAMVLPKLRRVILETISQLTNSNVARIEEHSAKSIAKLAIQSPKFLSPYMDSLLMALIPHLQIERRANVEVTIQAMNALSELCSIGGLNIVNCTNKLFAPLIVYLQDSTSLHRREAALRAMGAICQSTGYVVDPYKDYPELLEILLKLLKTELSSSMRRLTMKVLGIIGALDPYTHKVYLGTVYSNKSKSLALALPHYKEFDDPKSDVSNIIQWINYERCTLLEYYPALVIANLVEILKEKALSAFHKEVVYALFQIFSSLSSKSSQFVNQVVPRLITITEECKPELREFFFGQFSKLASIIGIQLKPHMKQIFKLIANAWYKSDNNQFRCVVIEFLQEVGKAFGQEFSPYVSDLCPYLLEIIENDCSKEKYLVLQALSCVKAIVRCIGNYLHLILPPILYVIDDKTAQDRVRLVALETLIVVASNQQVSERAPTIMQTWLRCIAVKLLQVKLMELLNIVMDQMWNQFLVYKDSVNAALIRYKVDVVFQEEFNERVAQILSSMKNNFGGAVFLRIQNALPSIKKPIVTKDFAFQKQIGRENRHLINVDQLRRFWIANSLNSKDDWLQWLSTLRTQFIRQSPSAYIRACATLAEFHEPLAKSLFNAAFMSVWTEINEFEQDELSNQLVDVLNSCPHAEPIQAILNLAEFMDHSEKGPLPVTYKMLSKCAEQTRAYAKALRYKELEIIKARNGEPNAEDCQALISYANKLNLEEYSAGVVQYAEKMAMDISGRWYEKLGEWEKAYEMYRLEANERIRHCSQQQSNLSKKNISLTSKNSLQKSNEDSVKTTVKDDLAIHQMRCLEALGCWEELESIGEATLKSFDDHANSNTRVGGLQIDYNNQNVISSSKSEFLSMLSEVDKQQKVAQMAARACWAMGNFEKMSTYVQKVNESTQDGAFLRAILAVKNNEFKEASDYIYKVRDMFDADLTTMAAESYERAYNATILVQQLTELEEAIEAKMIPEREPRIALLWSRRLQGCRRNIGQWQKILLVRSIVLSQTELRPMWIKYSALCRRQGKISMAKNTLKSLLGVSRETSLSKILLCNIALDEQSPHLALAICKQLWIEGDRRSAFISLENLTTTLHRLIDRKRVEHTWSCEKMEATARITAKCYLKLGEWHSQMHSTTILSSASSNLNNNVPVRRGNIAYPAGANFLGLNTSSAHNNFDIGPLQVDPVTLNVQQQQYLRQLTYQQQQQNRNAHLLFNFSNFEQSTKIVLQYYINATNFNPSWYKAWHLLATTYYNLVMTDRQMKNSEQQYQRNTHNTNNFVNPQILNQQRQPVTMTKLMNDSVLTTNELLTQYQQQQQKQHQKQQQNVVIQGQPVAVLTSMAYKPQVAVYTTKNSTAHLNINYPSALPAGYGQQQLGNIATNVPGVASTISTHNFAPSEYVLPPQTAMNNPNPNMLINVPVQMSMLQQQQQLQQLQHIQDSNQAVVNYNLGQNILPIGMEQNLRQRQTRFEIDDNTQQATCTMSGTTVQVTSSTNSSQSAAILKNQQQQQQLMNIYAAHAVRCFFKAIQLAEGSRLDDTLRLLMLWFDYGEKIEVFEVLRDSLKLVPLESWLEVMAQLISRLDSQQNTGVLVKQLIIDISKVHPQAVIYALTAAAKSRNSQRSKTAKEILAIMADFRPILVEQAQLLNDELIRCAILWHELWHEALEDASRYFFQEKNTDEMMNILRPLHAKIEKGHSTLKEQSFIQTYYKELKDAYEHCKAFYLTNNQKEMQAAWDLYFVVFKRMTSQLRQMTALDLNYISPRLVKAQNLEIAIPGSYDSQSPLITVVSIHNYLQVIMSKQKPRKIYMKGSDGKEYAFLLKGHEDPRQDERVMQLFGLINSLILREADTCRRNISIQRYVIVTLSQSSGLIGWLPNCDTLHALIKDYREKKKIVLSEEHSKMQKMVVDIDKVTLMQKVEVFEETLRSTSGDDLRQALWMKSPNSEVWFDRRTNYTRSMACMSMVGYILGLGDRHPSNLMLDRLSGKIVHIDFGDCFEVAMKREKYPEKIPFRLTRMLVQAMEVTGIEGNYRLTCERVLRLLSNNNDSILAVLEAFVYDPVLNWRLAEGDTKKQHEYVDGNNVNRQQKQAFDSKKGDSDAINRVKAKLCGRDFNQYQKISVSEQVNRLIEQATLNDNLCQCYIGWCPFW